VIQSLDRHVRSLAESGQPLSVMKSQSKLEAVRTTPTFGGFSFFVQSRSRTRKHFLCELSVTFSQSLIAIGSRAIRDFISG
jgi:hypothetical protein